MRTKIVLLITVVFVCSCFFPGWGIGIAKTLSEARINSSVEPKKQVQFSLVFPLQGKDPYHANAYAVFDHQMKNRWFKADGAVVDYKGEVATANKTSCFVIDGINELCSYSKSDNSDFLNSDMYQSKNILNYDGCPGWIYTHEKPETVVASAEGIVAFAGWLDPEAKGDYYGQHVIIDHQNGYSTIYAHMGKVTVKTGDFVSRGKSLGITGTTGMSESVNLYFEVRKYNIPVDPYGWDCSTVDPYIVTNDMLWEGDVEMVCQQTISKNHFKGEYWNGSKIDGDPLMTKDDGVFIDKTWGESGPCQECKINKDGFYVRWTKDNWFEDGIYVFEISSSNGFTLTIDGKKVKSDMDKPKKQTVKFEMYLSPTNHLIVFECRQAADSFAKLKYHPQEDVPILTLKYPNGSQIFRGGIRQTIAWESSGLEENSKINIYYSNNGKWFTIASDIPSNTNSIDWQVPNIDTTSCTVMIASVNDGSIESSDASDNAFAIYQNLQLKPSITLTKPVSGETFKAGDMATIEWESENLNPTGTISIFYFYQSKWITIGYNISNAKNSMKWKVPNTPTNGAYIMIQSTTAQTIEVSCISSKPIQITTK